MAGSREMSISKVAGGQPARQHKSLSWQNFADNDLLQMTADS